MLTTHVIRDQMLNMCLDAVASASVFTTLESPVGELLLTSDGSALTGAYPVSHRDPPATPGMRRDDAHFTGVRDQLRMYFRGKLSAFSVPLRPAGTPFQLDVWRALTAIPCATTRTYADVAASVGRASAHRATGGAVGKNPIAIIVPCHRVVGSAGRPTAYSGGLELWRWLFEHEAAMVPPRIAYVSAEALSSRSMALPLSTLERRFSPRAAG